jgi:hypothetical protein
MMDITSIENNILKEQLTHEISMKNHYAKISGYSEKDAEQSEKRAVFFKEMNEELKYLIDTERTAYTNITKEHARVTKQDKATIKHFESVIAGYEMQLYESMVASEADVIKYAKLESTIDKITLFGKLLTFGLIICFILYNIQKAVLNRKPKTTKTIPLTSVKKEEPKKPSTKETNKKPETTPIVEDKKKPLNNTPVTEPAPINPKEPMTFSLFIDDIKRKKDIRRTLKLEALKAKELTQKPGDIIEETSIQDTNKALAGGVLKKILKYIMTAKAPKKTKKSPNSTGETDVNKSKVKPKAKPSVSTPPKNNTRGRSNDKNKKDKSTPEQKDKK